MGSFFASYLAFFQSQFLTPWFCVWLAPGVFMGLPNKGKIAGWLIGSVTIITPLIIMIMIRNNV